MNNKTQKRCTCGSELLYWLREKYGELLDLEEIAEFYKYPSVEAVRKAHLRGTIPVELYTFPRKTGFYAKASDVAASIGYMRISAPDRPQKIADN